MKKLFETLSAMASLSDSFKEYLTRHMVLLSLPKNHLLLEASRVSDQVFYLNTGHAMSFRFIGGKKHIEEFFAPGSILVSPHSFFEQLPSRESIQLLEASDVLHIGYPHVMYLFEHFPEANRLYQITMNRYYEGSRERIHDLQHLSAVERYEKLMEQYPKIKHLVALEHIATYLGIVPQSLSRIRRDTDLS